MNRARLVLLGAVMVVSSVGLTGCNKDKSGVGKPDMVVVDLASPEDLSMPDLSLADLTPPPDLLPPSCTSEITSCGNPDKDAPDHLCGKVVDSCSGTVFQCDGCNDGKVCDLDTHTCITPKLNCADFAAECGEIINSCGKRFDCGYCMGTKECNPDTKKCGDCSNATCQDFGYECGKAWTDCGSANEATNYVDCGTCGDGKVCNEASHICEPNCTPPQTPDEIAAYCATQKTNKGIQCGYTTDGCGGQVFCGNCAPGLKCGLRGVANRCEPNETPVECQALGKVCGTLTSACDKSLVYCGDCPTGEVCNDNGTCGPPCQPKTCAEVLTTGQDCGNNLDDGCMGKVTCSCGADQLCSPDNKCVAVGQCSMFTTEMAGQPCSKAASPAFPLGDGSNLSCPCMGANLFCVSGGAEVTGSNAGTCCLNTGGVCAANNGAGGPCTVTNTCTGTDPTNCCTGNQICDTRDGATKNTCVDKCVLHGATGGNTSPCSDNNRSYFDNDKCPCAGNLTCVGESAGAPGACCMNTGVSCSGVDGLGGVCNTTNTCGGLPKGCCGNTTYCDTPNNKCVKAKVCGDYSANGAAGDPCSRGPSSTFPRGDGSNLKCDCGANLFCVTDPTPGNTGNGDGVLVPTDGTVGKCEPKPGVDPNNPLDCVALGGFTNGTNCCFLGANTCKNDITDCGKTEPTNCVGYIGAPATFACAACDCADYLTPAQQPAGGKCTVNGTNDTAPGLTCPCAAGNSCTKTPSTTDKDGEGICCPTGQVFNGTSCVAAKNCASYTGVALNASGASDLGKKCSRFNFYDNGSGGVGDFSCKCSQSPNPGYQNETCTGDGSGAAPAEGTCTCIKNTCDCSNGGQSDGCGGTVTCCGSGEICRNNGASCCTPKNCVQTNPTWECGTSLDACSNQNTSCGTCAADKYCDGNHKCQPKATCASLGKTGQAGPDGAPGSGCNDSNFYPAGDGSKFPCGCDTSAKKTNNQCVGDSPTVEGACVCVKNSCAGQPRGTIDDGCGGFENCGG